VSNFLGSVQYPVHAFSQCLRCDDARSVERVDGRAVHPTEIFAQSPYLASTFSTASVMAWAPVLIDGSGTGA